MMLKKIINRNTIIITMIVTLFFNTAPLSVFAATTDSQNEKIENELLKEDKIFNIQDFENVPEELTPEDKEAIEYYLETGEFPEAYAVAPWLAKLAKLVAGPVIETLLTWSLDQALDYMSKSAQGSANEQKCRFV